MARYLGAKRLANHTALITKRHLEEDRKTTTCRVRKIILARKDAVTVFREYTPNINPTLFVANRRRGWVSHLHAVHSGKGGSDPHASSVERARSTAGQMFGSTLVMRRANVEKAQPNSARSAL